MDIPNKRHPDCPSVHLGLCSECIRLWRREKSDAEFGDRDEDRTGDAPKHSPAVVQSGHECGDRIGGDASSEVLDGVASGSKPDRLAVAKKALLQGNSVAPSGSDRRKDAEAKAVIETVEALSDAVRASRYRENKKKADPDWLKREAKRKKKARRIRGSPKSPEE